MPEPLSPPPRRARWAAIGAIAAAGAVIVYLALPSFDVPDELERGPYVGCYRGGGTNVRLDPDGSFVTPEGRWRWRVIATEEGERLATSGAVGKRVDGRIQFAPPVKHGTLSPIRKGEGFTLAALGEDVAFAKAPCEQVPMGVALRGGERRA